MTNNTSRRSAKATPKPEPEPDTNGTPTDETASESGNGSGTTTWVVMIDRNTYKVTTPGSNGRMVVGGRGYSTKFYKNQTDRHYVGALGESVSVFREDVILEDVTPKLTSTKPTPAGTVTIDAAGLELLARKVVAGATGSLSWSCPECSNDIHITSDHAIFCSNYAEDV